MRAAALALALAACGGPAFPDAALLALASDGGQLHLEVRSDPQPPVVGVATFQYVVTDAGGAPVEGLALAVTPFMPEMEMGTSVHPTITEQGDGAYLLEDVDLVMAGTWELQTEFTGPVDDTAAPSFDVP